MTKEEFQKLGWIFERAVYSPKFIAGNWNHAEKVESEWRFVKEVEVYQIKLVLKFRIHRNEVHIYGRYPDDSTYFIGKVDKTSDLEVVDRCIVTMLLIDLNAPN